jgi:formate/nitrite transporter
MRNINEFGELIHNSGIKKTKYTSQLLLILSIQAGMYIAFGGIFYTLVTSYGGHPALIKVLGGIVFSLGLILVVVGGSELFTGNNLMVIPYLNKKISFKALLRNWSIVYLGNFIGSLLIVTVMYFTGLFFDNNGHLALRALEIAEYKVSISFWSCFTRAILCNILVCLALWSAMMAKTLQGKVIGILFPITAFVALGFEHSIANMYFIPTGLLLKITGGFGNGFESINFISMFENLIPVTLGNIVGGVFFVAVAYWAIHKEEFNTKQ